MFLTDPRFLMTPFAVLTARASSPVFSSTAFATCDHWRRLVGVSAFLSWRVAPAGVHGIYFAPFGTNPGFPRAAKLARFGYPLARRLQRRFAAASLAAMRQAVLEAV